MTPIRDYNDEIRRTPENQASVHHASDHVEPAADFYRRQQDLEKFEQLARQLAISVGEQDVKEGISEAEIYVNQGGVDGATEVYVNSRSNREGYFKATHAYMTAVGDNLKLMRDYELDTHWSLGEFSEKHLGLVGRAVRQVTTWVTGEEAQVALPILSGVTERQLLQRENEIGSKLFGPVSTDVQRAFYNLDPTTWIWHEEYTDHAGISRSVTTRYEVKEVGILKAQDNKEYTYIEGEELKHFSHAVQGYYTQVTDKVYGRNPATGRKLPA